MMKHLVFWLWNDRMTPALIRKQLAMMKQEGVGGVFFHSMPDGFGGTTYPEGMPDYLSKHYFRMIREAVAAATELHMESYLYDEGGWPSGTVDGKLVKEHPEWRAAYLLPNHSGDGVEKKFVDSCPDLLRPESTRYFIEHVHDQYYKELGPSLWKEIKGIFTDEPFFGLLQPKEKGLPYSDAFPAELRKYTESSVEETACRIFYGTEEESTAALWIWRRVLSALVFRNYFQPLRTWCHAHGILFVGHPRGDDYPAKIGQSCGDGFRMYQYFDIPGLDVIWHQISPREMEVDYPKYITSAARHAGRRRVLSESFAVYGNECSLEEMRQIADAQYVLGVTDIIPMALYSSTRGSRQFEHQCNLFAPDPRWEFYKDFARYCSRVGSLIASGRETARIGVLLPYDNLINKPFIWGIQSRKALLETPFFKQTRFFREEHFGYDYVGDREVLRAKLTARQELRIGRADYQILIVPDGVAIFPELEQRIAELEQASFPIIRGSEAERVRDFIAPDLEIGGEHTSLRVLRLNRGKQPFFFIFNSAKSTVSFTCRTDFSEPYEWYDPLTEEASPADSGMSGFVLSGLRSIVLRPQSRLCQLELPDFRKLAFDGAWHRKMVFQHAYSDRGFRKVRAKAGETESECGVFDFSNTIKLDSIPAKILLRLPEEAAGMWEIRVNGHSVGRTAWTPFELELSRFMRLGKNRIVCRLVTTAGAVYRDADVQKHLKEKGWLNSHLTNCCMPFPADPLPKSESLPEFLLIM